MEKQRNGHWNLGNFMENSSNACANNAFAQSMGGATSNERNKTKGVKLSFE